MMLTGDQSSARGQPLALWNYHGRCACPFSWRPQPPSFLNPAPTRYVESAAFRAELEKETAKGLHFPSSRYAPIRRIGFLTAVSDKFEAAKGRKRSTEFDVGKDLKARFNPFGAFGVAGRLTIYISEVAKSGIQTL